MRKEKCSRNSVAISEKMRQTGEQLEQTCAEGKVEGVEWHEKVVSEVASWNDGREEEEEGSILCIPKIWLN